jgi:iron-only hydrogenase group A
MMRLFYKAFLLLAVSSIVTTRVGVGGFAFVARTTKQYVSTRLPTRQVIASPLFSTVAPVKDKVGAPDSPKLTPEATELEAILQNKNGKLLVAQTAPSVRVAFSEEFGLPPGAFSPEILVASLKKLGFDIVLDTNLAADLCICEEGSELLHRIKLREKRREEKGDTLDGIQSGVAVEDEPLPLFTSCCPGWMTMLEKNCPDLVPYVSSCKSPHMMMGAVMKRYSGDLLGRDPSEVYLTSVMPCVKKRGESDRPAFASVNGIRDVDNVITTVDLGMLLRKHDIDPTQLEPSTFDSPFQTDEDARGSGAGQLFGATGGVMEAAVRSVYELVTGAQLPRLELEEVRGLEGVKAATIPLYDEKTGKGLKDTDLRVAVANGLGNAKTLIKELKEGTANYDFVEIMACPGGCIGGGGQPRSKDKDVVAKRLEVIYNLDKSLPVRRSHENPTVKRLYKDILGEMGGETAHKVLHVKQVYGGKREPEKDAQCVLDDEADE